MNDIDKDMSFDGRKKEVTEVQSLFDMKPGGQQKDFDENMSFEETKRHVSDTHGFIDTTLLVEDDRERIKGASVRQQTHSSKEHSDIDGKLKEVTEAQGFFDIKRDRWILDRYR